MIRVSRCCFEASLASVLFMTCCGYLVVMNHSSFFSIFSAESGVSGRQACFRSFADVSLSTIFMILLITNAFPSFIKCTPLPSLAYNLCSTPPLLPYNLYQLSTYICLPSLWSHCSLIILFTVKDTWFMVVVSFALTVLVPLRGGIEQRTSVDVVNLYFSSGNDVDLASMQRTMLVLYRLLVSTCNRLSMFSVPYFFAVSFANLVSTHLWHFWNSNIFDIWYSVHASTY